MKSKHMIRSYLSGDDIMLRTGNKQYFIESHYEVDTALGILCILT